MSEKSVNGVDVGSSHLVNIEVPGEVAAAAMTQWPELLVPLMSRLMDGEVLPQGQVIALVSLIGDQIKRLYQCKRELVELGHAVDSLNQAEKHVDRASEQLREQLQATMSMLLKMNIGGE